MALTMLTRALMGTAAPEEEGAAPPPNPARTVVPKPAPFKPLTATDKSKIRSAWRSGSEPDDIVKMFADEGFDPQIVRGNIPTTGTRAVDIGRAVQERTGSTTTANVRAPVIPVRTSGGRAPGSTPNPSVNVKTVGGMSDDDAYAKINQQILEGTTPAPQGYREAKDPVAFLRELGDPTLSAIRGSEAGQASGRYGGQPNPPASRASRMAPQGTTTTQHVVPRTTFTLPPFKAIPNTPREILDDSFITTDVPKIIKHFDAFQSGNKNVRNVDQFLTSYAKQYGSEGTAIGGQTSGDATLAGIANAYVQNTSPAAKAAIASVAQGYTNLLRSSVAARANGFTPKDVRDAYDAFRIDANTLLGKLNTADQGTIKAQTNQFKINTQHGLVGAMSENMTASEVAELKQQHGDINEMHFKPGVKTTGATGDLDTAVKAVKNAGITVAVNELTKSFRPSGSIPNSTVMDAATTTKAHIIEALATHPESPLNRILTEQITSALKGVENAKPNTLARLAKVTGAGRSGASGQAGDNIANAFDANIAKELGIPKMLMSHVGLHFGGRGVSGNAANNFVTIGEQVVQELRKGTNTDWTKVAGLLRPYLSADDFDVIMPRTGITRTAQNGAGGQNTYSPDIEKQKLLMSSVEELTGINPERTAPGRIANFGQNGLAILQEVQQNNPELYKSLVERTMRSPLGGRTDVGDVKGQGRTLRTQTVDPVTGAVKQTFNNRRTAPVGPEYIAPLDLKQANAIWHSLVNPQRAHDYVPGQVNTANGQKNLTPGQLLEAISDASDIIGKHLKHPTEKVNIGDRLTEGQLQREAGRTVQRPDSDRFTRNEASQLTEYYTKFGIHPTAFNGITAKENGTPAQHKLFEIQNDPKTRAEWQHFSELEKKAVTALSRQTVEGGAFGKTEVSGKGKAGSTTAITSEINSIADELIGSEEKDPTKARQLKLDVIDYLRSLKVKANQTSSSSLPLLQKFLNMEGNYSPSIFGVFDPRSRVDQKLPGGMSWQDAWTLAKGVEATVREHGSKHMKDLLVNPPDSDKQAGFKVLRTLAEKPELVFGLLRDMSETAGLKVTGGRPDAPRSVTRRPTEDAALRRGGPRQGKDALWHNVLGAVNSALGVKNENEIGNKGPQGAGYQKPGAPVRDQMRWQPFMGGSNRSPAGAMQWYTDVMNVADRIFDTGSVEHNFATKIARDLAHGEPLDRVMRNTGTHLTSEEHHGPAAKTTESVVKKLEQHGVRFTAPKGAGLIRKPISRGKILGLSTLGLGMAGGERLMGGNR
jgi:hypothetical protein